MSMTAYNLSRFAAQEEREPAPIRASLRVENGKKVNNYRGRVTVCLVLLFSVMSLTVYSNMLLTETRAMSVSRAEELTRLESEYSYLNWQLENMISLRNAADFAENELGLIKISASQIEYLNLRNDNRIVEGEAAAGAGGLLNRIWNAITMVFSS